TTEAPAPTSALRASRPNEAPKTNAAGSTGRIARSPAGVLAGSSPGWAAAAIPRGVPKWHSLTRAPLVLIGILPMPHPQTPPGGRFADGPGPLYRRLAQAIADAAERGDLEPGAPLPAERVLAGLLGVSRTTAVAAYAELQERGVIERRRGSGT